MTGDDDEMHVYLDDDGVPAGVVDLKELILASQRLAGDLALHGNDDVHVRAVLDEIGAYGNAAFTVLRLVIQELAVLAYNSIDIYAAVGYPMKEQLQRFAAGETVGSVGGWWDNAQPSRAERRKKRRR